MDRCKGCGVLTRPTLVCPECRDHGKEAPFCSQECYRRSWRTHIINHRILKRTAVDAKPTKTMFGKYSRVNLKKSRNRKIWTSALLAICFVLVACRMLWPKVRPATVRLRGTDGGDFVDWHAHKQISGRESLLKSRGLLAALRSKTEQAIRLEATAMPDVVLDVRAVAAPEEAQTTHVESEPTAAAAARPVGGFAPESPVEPSEPSLSLPRPTKARLETTVAGVS